MSIQVYTFGMNLLHYFWQTSFHLKATVDVIFLSLLQQKLLMHADSEGSTVYVLCLQYA